MTALRHRRQLIYQHAFERCRALMWVHVRVELGIICIYRCVPNEMGRQQRPFVAYYVLRLATSVCMHAVVALD
jgi:hypothetical protein